MCRQSLARTLLLGLLLLLFFQLLADFVEATYAFGLLSLSLTAESASVLLLLSPLLLLLRRRDLTGWPLVLLGGAVLACRAAEPLLATRVRMLVSGAGVACFLIILPGLLSRARGRGAEVHGLTWGLGLALSLSLSALFRVLGSGSDLSTEGGTRWLGWAIAAVAGGLMVGLWRPGPATEGSAGPQEEDRDARAGFWRIAGLALGALSALLLLYFSLSSPTVIARWTGASAVPILALGGGALAAVVLTLVAAPRLRAALTPGVVMLWNLLFLACLVGTLLAHQIAFPSDPGAYPLPEPAVTAGHRLPLVLMLLLSPVIVVDLMLLAEELIRRRPSSRALGGAFGLAGLFLVVLILAHIFTTVYDYIPVVGPFFRDKFWLVYLVAGLGLAGPMLLARRREPVPPAADRHGPSRLAIAALAALLSAAAVAGNLSVSARPPAAPSGARSLTVLTYNLRQGYSQDGQRNYAGQLELLRSLDADVIGLQECDTARIAGGNADVVRYVADRLDLYSYYGPKTVVGTFGIALLSRYPIQNPRTFYMFSEGEQTATIAAQIEVDGRTFHLFVTHLGNGGPLVQQEAVLHAAEGLDHVVLMGDFNFRPDTEQYALTTGKLDDAWLLRWPGGAADQGIDPARRIDHIFVSPGTQVAESVYLPSPASDHPALIAVIEW